jgi:hypothetical protein
MGWRIDYVCVASDFSSSAKRKADPTLFSPIAANRLDSSGNPYNLRSRARVSAIRTFVDPNPSKLNAPRPKSSADTDREIHARLRPVMRPPMIRSSLGKTPSEFACHFVGFLRIRLLVHTVWNSHPPLNAVRDSYG